MLNYLKCLRGGLLVRFLSYSSIEPRNPFRHAEIPRELEEDTVQNEAVSLPFQLTTTCQKDVLMYPALLQLNVSA